MAALLLSLLGCGQPAEERAAPAHVEPLRVLAAASLVDVLPRVAASWEARSGRRIELVTGASSALARQIEAGAPCDVFVSADPRFADELAAHGSADAATRTVLAQNHLVVVVPADRGRAFASLAELDDASIEHVALARAEVPAGRAAREALTQAGILARIEPRIVSATDVRAALAWAARGEADAAMVYATDALAEPRVRVALTIGDEAHAPIVYVGIAIRGGDLAGAGELLRAMTSDAARDTWRGQGFDVAPLAP